jgi:hypothetical protein
MVAKGDNGKPVQVPRLILEDFLDVKRFGEAMFRKELRQYRKEKMAQNQHDISRTELIDLMKDERCDITYNTHQ